MDMSKYDQGEQKARCSHNSPLQALRESQSQNQPLSLFLFKLAPVPPNRQISYYKTRLISSKMSYQMSGQRDEALRAMNTGKRDAWLSMKRHNIQIMLTNTLWANKILSMTYLA